MQRFMFKIIYFIVFFIIIGNIKKVVSDKAAGGKTSTGNSQTGKRASEKGGYDTFNSRGSASGTMPHKHKEKGVYDTFNKRGSASGTMPHKHEKGHYTSMPDVTKLPPGYILLNGEPVRVADLEGK